MIVIVIVIVTVVYLEEAFTFSEKIYLQWKSIVYSKAIIGESISE